MTAPARWTNQELKAISDPLVPKFKEIAQKLTVIKDRSAWHKKAHASLAPRASAAAEDLKKVKTLANKPKDDDKPVVDPTKLTAEIKAIVAALDAALAKKRSVTYYFGQAKVPDQKAVEAKAKAVLPAADEKFASQAVTDAINGKNLKDAGKAGRGVKHASSGTPGKGSCTIFFTFDEHDDGLERRFVVVGVGSHATATTYTIHKSFVPGLTVGGKPFAV